jgi:subtilisin-like proprotein convertase family protein
VRMVAALGVATGIGLAAPALAAAQTFSNTAPITINDSGACLVGGPSPAPGAASPYPSQITVSGLGEVTDVNVTITGLSHSFPDDVDVLLVGPGGQSTLLMADSGGGEPGVSGVDVTFDDAAAASLPDGTAFASGTYKPTIGTGDVSTCTVPASFPSPAPAGPYGSSLSVFNGTNPNGTWSLYVIDDDEVDVGSIAGGWSLEISAEAPGAAEIAALQELVTGLELPKGLTTALNSKLDEALAALDADDTAAACDSLQAFLNQVAAQSGKKLTAAQAQQLSDAANEIRALLDC